MYEPKPVEQCSRCWVDLSDGKVCPLVNDCPYQPYFVGKDGNLYRRHGNGSVSYLGPADQAD